MKTRVNDSPTTVTSLKQRPARRFFTKKEIVFSLLTLILLVVISIGGISLYFSKVLLEVTHGPETYTTSVISVSAQTVTLQRTPSTEREGTFGLNWPGGQAIV